MEAGKINYSLVTIVAMSTEYLKELLSGNKVDEDTKSLINRVLNTRFK